MLGALPWDPRCTRLPSTMEVWGQSPQLGHSMQSPWWSRGGKAPWSWELFSFQASNKRHWCLPIFGNVCSVGCTAFR